ncbi:hypothetical protein H4R35_003440, partial [Dimargaris xerosporica]
MGGTFFRGASMEQDARFKNKAKQLRRSTKFPPEFDQKVNMSKVNFTVIRPWVSQQITETLGFEDEVVLEYIFGLLESETPDPKDMQINLTGFLTDKAGPFVLNLWKMLLSAQENLGGIPPQILEQKKQELLEKKRQAERIQAEISQEKERITQQQISAEIQQKIQAIQQ